MKRAIGLALMISPFATIFIMATAEHSLLFALGCFGISALIIVVMWMGIVLFEKD
tara:strand:+ start:2970 stop:3134 length:165 start_codon:yes stop_codon:yes gene_type:complete